MFQDIDIGDQFRTVSRPLTPEMAEVAKIQPDLFTLERGGLCYSSPKNFIGALLQEMTKTDNINQIMMASRRIPDTVRTPYLLLNDVALTNFNDQSRETEFTNWEAELVFYKRSCGTGAGLVIKGPLSGLILRNQPGSTINDALCINRIWNDSVAQIYEAPYRPFIDYPEEKLFDPYKMSRTLKSLFQTPTSIAELNSQISNRIFNQYRAELIEAQKVSSGEVYKSDLFLRLAEKLGLPIDKELFHFTRVIPGLERLEKRKYTE